MRPVATKTEQTLDPQLPKRLIGHFVGKADGPTLVAVGSIHGNEPSGRIALERVARFLSRAENLLKGRVWLLTGNVKASVQQTRYVDVDLNRRWTREHILRNSAENHRPDHTSEDSEQHELLKIFGEILRTAADEVFVLDLHTTSADGTPFATVGDTMRNRRFALKFPVTILLGIEEQLEGTLLEFLNNEGAVTLGFEAGQHDAGSSIANHEALVFAALVHAGILSAEQIPRFREYEERLRRSTGRPGVIEVRHREPVAPEDGFSMEVGFRNFDRVKAGQLLATNRSGEIRARESGMILMPLYQKQGEDGFFIVRRVASLWLTVSAILRRMDAARFVRFLPGVQVYPKSPEQFQVNTRIARLVPLQVFHLLGFRRLRWKRHFLFVSRRRFDTAGPFTKRERLR